MLCCFSANSTVDDGITETSEERRQRIVPGFTRPESELDWEEITVFQWPNDNASEGYQRPASTIGSQAAENIVRQHEAKIAAVNNPAIRQSNDLNDVPPLVAEPKKKRQGLFAKSGNNKNRQAPGPPKEGERLPGDIPRRPVPPPLPPGRDELPHLTARRLKSQTANNSNNTEQTNGQVHESTHRKAIPLHGNLQLNFSVPGISNDPDGVKNHPSGTVLDISEQRGGKSKNKTGGSKRSKLSLKFKRPTFLSDSAFGTKKKDKRKSPKSYRAPDPPGFHPPSSIDTGITEGRLPLAERLPLENRLGTIEEPEHWRNDINGDDMEFDRDRSPSERLVGEYDPKNYVNKVPAQDASGNELPQWKRLLIAKQLAEKALVDDEEQARKEEEERRFKDMPGWKRALVEKKEAENRARREREQDIAAMEWAARNPSKSGGGDAHKIALDEDGLPMTPWQAEAEEQSDSKSGISDNSRAISGQ